MQRVIAGIILRMNLDADCLLSLIYFILEMPFASCERRSLTQEIHSLGADNGRLGRVLHNFSPQRSQGDPSDVGSGLVSQSDKTWGDPAVCPD